MPKLIPFPSSHERPADQHGLSGLFLEADARIEGKGDQRKLVLTYSAGGAIEKILWPARLTGKPQRKDELWKHTCFEAFIKPAGQDRYWEVNLSPSGDWNIYSFNAYRQGMMQEKAIQNLTPRFTQDGAVWHLSCEIWIAEWAKASELAVGLTAVIEETSSEISYWAIAHPEPLPDFHLAESFTNRIKMK
jgi:hypothetical protein